MTKWPVERDPYTPTPRECLIALLGGTLLLLVLSAALVVTLVVTG